MVRDLDSTESTEAEGELTMSEAIATASDAGYLLQSVGREFPRESVSALSPAARGTAANYRYGFQIRAGRALRRCARDPDGPCDVLERAAQGDGLRRAGERVRRRADDARFRSADANAAAPAGLARLHAATNPRAGTAHPRDREKSARRGRAQGPVRRDGGSRQSAAGHGDQRFARRAARGIPAIQKLVGQDNRSRQHAPRDADPRRDQERLH